MIQSIISTAVFFASIWNHGTFSNHQAAHVSILCKTSDDAGCAPSSLKLLCGSDVIYSKELDFTPSDKFLFKDKSVLLIGYKRGLSGASIRCAHVTGEDVVILMLDPAGVVVWRQSHQRSSITAGGAPFPIFVDATELGLDKLALAVRLEFPNRDQVWLLDRKTGALAQKVVLPKPPPERSGYVLGGCKVVAGAESLSKVACVWYQLSIKYKQVDAVDCWVAVADADGMKLQDGTVRLSKDEVGEWSRSVGPSLLTLGDADKECGGVSVNVLNKRVFCIDRVSAGEKKP